MRQFYRPGRGVTYRHAPDLHPVSVADHQAKRGVRGATVHLHELWIAGSVCANRHAVNYKDSNHTVI